MVVSRLDDLEGKRAYGGLCAASATDLASLCWLFRSPDKDESVWALWRFFYPADRIVDLRRRSGGLADSWVKNGWLTLTEGDQLDIEGITEAIRADALRFNVRELAFDASGTAIGITQPLQLDFADRLVSVYPSTPGSSLVDWEQMLRAGTFNHGGNPIAAWQASQALGASDRRGRHPDRPQGLTGERLWHHRRRTGPQTPPGRQEAPPQRLRGPRTQHRLAGGSMSKMTDWWKDISTQKPASGDFGAMAQPTVDSSGPSRRSLRPRRGEIHPPRRRWPDGLRGDLPQAAERPHLRELPRAEHRPVGHQGDVQGPRQGRSAGTGSPAHQAAAAPEPAHAPLRLHPRHRFRRLHLRRCVLVEAVRRQSARRCSASRRST